MDKNELEKKSLLGTFINSKDVPQTLVREIVEKFDVDKIFVFNIQGNEDKTLITFNVKNIKSNSELKGFKNKYKNTVQFHRNKNNNILFTINALNKLIEKESGKKDTNYKINWTNYKNCCIMSNEDSVKIVKIQKRDIINFN